METSKTKNFFNPNNSSAALVASAFGGMITSLVMTPLDVIKIRMQSASKAAMSENCFIYCNGLMDHLCACANGLNVSRGRMPWYSRHDGFKSFGVRCNFCHNPGNPESCSYHSGIRYYRIASRFNIALSGTISSAEALSTIIKNEGLLSLWSGLSPTLVMALPQTVIYYSVNDWIKDKLGYNEFAIEHNQNNKINSKMDLLPPIVGAVSRIVSVFAISPLELMRTKLQSKKISLKHFFELFRSTVVQDGMRCLWMGMGPTLLRDVPYSAVFWYVYDYNKSRHHQRALQPGSLLAHPASIDFPVAFFYGALAGFTAGLVTHPFDVIKTHRQLELGESIFGNRAYPKSTWVALKNLYRRKGLTALYSGFTPRLVKTTTASAIMISMFEVIKQHLSS